MFSRGKRKKKSFRMGISGKMILNIALPTATILIILAAIITTTVVNTIYNLKNKDITNQMETVSNRVVQYFEPFFTAEQFIKNNNSIKQLFSELETSTIPYRFENSEFYQQALSDLKYANTISGDGVKGVWIAGIKNSEIIQSDGYISETSFDITERLWYKTLLEKPGESIVSSVYEDAAGGGLVVTIATPYYNNSKEMVGVIGIDLLIDDLINYFGQLSIGESGYVTVYDSEQNLVFHPDSSMIMTNLSNISYSENMKELIQNNQNSEIIEYKYNNSKFHGATLYIDNFNWSVLACMPNSEYMHETTIIFSMLMIGFLLCIIIISLVCLFRTKALIKPLKNIGTVAEEFAKGKLDSNIIRNTNDEIGDLEEIFSKTQVNLKSIISDIALVLHEISNKNLTIETSATYEGDFVEIKNSLHGIIISMNETMHQVRIAADQVDAGSSQVSNGAQALAQGASEQASSVKELSDNVKDISDKINHTAQSAEIAQNQTIAAKNSLDRSSEKMQELVNAMEQIKNTSGQIQGIIKTIDDIAFQTNILALNASVEAARAGTSGKGFAVVADEVRNLAGKSAEASKTTQNLIKAAINAVETGNKLVSHTAEDLEETATNASLVMKSIIEIAKASIEEAKSISDVTSGLNQISDVVQTNAATAEESAASSEELSGQANMLRQLINEFNFSDNILNLDTTKNSAYNY